MNILFDIIYNLLLSIPTFNTSHRVLIILFLPAMTLNSSPKIFVDFLSNLRKLLFKHFKAYIPEAHRWFVIYFSGASFRSFSNGILSIASYLFFFVKIIHGLLGYTMKFALNHYYLKDQKALS